jgi:hypothetical protein
MTNTKTKELIFIFLAIFCQLFASMNMSFLNTYLKGTQGYADVFFASDELRFIYWMLLTIFGRIFGAYFIGKYADKFGFFKSIVFVSKSFVVLSVLCAVFCLTHEISYEINRGFYLLRFFYCFLEPAALIFPSLYLLNRSSHLNQYKLSTLLLAAVFIAKSASYHLIYLPPALMEFWCVLPLIATALSWGIYSYLAKNSAPLTATTSKKSPMPSQLKILSTLFGAACATGAFYHHFFVSYYSVNINIVDANFDLGSVVYYTLCGLFLFPAAKLCEKFGLYKTTRISLVMLFILGMNAILASPTSTMYFVQQLLFSFFSALFIAPILVVLHRLYKSCLRFSDTMFWFMLGFSGCTVLAFCEQQLAKQKGFSGIGWCVYSASIFLCLIAIHKFRSNTILGERSKVDSAPSIKLFEA